MAATAGLCQAGSASLQGGQSVGAGGYQDCAKCRPYSFAHSFFEAHGPSLCATALRVDDGHQSLERARAFKGQPYRGLVGPNEREIPSVRAPDGSLIYLVDSAGPGESIYDSDFVVDPQAVAKGGLQRIDHMAMALPADSLDSWVLFYKSILDFEADDEVVLPDPYGLVKSRALRSRCSTVRLPLNISENRNTAISHALSSYRGSGVHHIAFSCEDIFAEVSRAKEAGVPLLDIPLNYYDDLAARFDFDEEFLSELAYYNVLYDRDAQGGELFHVYTDAFDGRFFFEILQRKNGYVGYGAANVPVRLAAMAKARNVAARQARL
ncbi:4-hydroxyphenylpyruvate dioxygenase [Pseudomonas syringae pv. rhaphiolepidis]|nr:4-hydroxyphenylpyruvate dioxygenase [Pseudomonas syringae pv. rhaphiolepidis]